MFVDESGHRNIEKIDKEWPILVITGVIIAKEEYIKIVRPCFLCMKEMMWEEGLFPYKSKGVLIDRRVCLHSSDMRKKSGPFQNLSDDERKIFDRFYKKNITKSDYIVVSAIIDKEKIMTTHRHIPAIDKYSLAVGMVMERFIFFLREQTGKKQRGCIVFESRNPVEDMELFRFIKKCRDAGTGAAMDFNVRGIDQGAFNRHIRKVGWHPKWNNDQKVVSGLELADNAAWHHGIFI
jgi:hypothetical protein